jgi:hypothetical protein
MKNLNLFVVAVVATVAFASCGGGKTDGGADTTKKDTATVVVPMDTTKKDTTATVPMDTTKAKTK